MKRDLHTIIETVSRGLRLRCPACGRASIVQSPFRIRKTCPVCSVSFNREEGFFVGAILVNVVATEASILLVYLVSIASHRDINQSLLTVLFVLAVAFPLVFYHHSWAIWLSFDHLVESLPQVSSKGPRGKLGSPKD